MGLHGPGRPRRACPPGRAIRTRITACLTYRVETGALIFVPGLPHVCARCAPRSAMTSRVSALRSTRILGKTTRDAAGGIRKDERGRRTSTQYPSSKFEVRIWRRAVRSASAPECYFCCAGQPRGKHLGWEQGHRPLATRITRRSPPSIRTCAGISWYFTADHRSNCCDAATCPRKQQILVIRNNRKIVPRGPSFGSAV